MRDDMSSAFSVMFFRLSMIPVSDESIVLYLPMTKSIYEPLMPGSIIAMMAMAPDAPMARKDSTPLLVVGNVLTK